MNSQRSTLQTDIRPARRIWRRAALFGAAALAATSIMAGAMQDTTADNPRGAVRRPAPTEIRMYALKYTDAIEVQRTIQQLVPVRITVDQRTNTIIMDGTPGQHEQIAELLPKLDTAVDPKTEGTIRIIQFDRPNAAAAIASTLDDIYNGYVGYARVSYDGLHNTLILQGDSGALRIAEDLVEHIRGLDKSTGQFSPEPTELQVRLVWLVGGLDRDSAPDPPADLNSAVEQLRKLGVTNLKLAAQAIVRASTNGEFEMECVAQLDNRCELEFAGNIGQFIDDEVPMYVQIGATQSVVQNAPGARRAMAEQLASLRTQITTSPGHTVVLGATPMGEMTSVFILQVRRVE